MQGKIIKGIAGFYYVYAEDGVLYQCKAKGIFRKDKQKPLVGDDVVISVLDVADSEGNVDELLPRRNSLIRPAVANVDQAFVIFAARDPAPNRMLLDSFLIMMERQGIPVIICINKTDLGDREELLSLASVYEGCGYKVLLTSIRRGEGLDLIRAALDGKTTVVAGPSGVGKSSITNWMQPDIRMETGEISRKLKRGRHTTRHSQIIPVDQRTFLVDTPGFSSLFLPEELMEEDLWRCFPEFVRYEPDCRFQGCRHIHEPDCAVKKALEEGRIDRERYENYLLMHEELRQRKKY